VKLVELHRARRSCGLRIGVCSLDQAVLLVIWRLPAVKMLLLLRGLDQFEDLHLLAARVEHATIHFLNLALVAINLQRQKTRIQAATSCESAHLAVLPRETRA